MKTLIFFEKIGDKELISEYLKKEEVKFIALSPEAAYELEKEGIRYKNPYDYLTYDDIKELGVLAEVKLNKLIEYLDKKIQDYDNRFKENNLTPFFHNVYKFKLFYDNLCIKAAELHKILKEECPDKVVYCSHAKQLIDNILLVDKRESVYGQILGYPVFRNKYNKINWIELKGREIKEDSRNTFNERIIWKTKLLIKKFLLLFLKCISVRKIKKTKHTVLIDEGKNIGFIVSRLEKLGIRPVEISRKKIQKILNDSGNWQRCMDFFEEDSKIHQFCFFEEYDFFELVKERFIFFAKTLEGYYKLYRYFINYLEKEKIRLILQENMYSAPLVEASGKLNIPITYWIHGGCCLFREAWPITDFRFADYYLVYGSKMKEDIDRDYAGYRMDVRAVGCPYIERFQGKIAERKERKRERIVFALRDYSNNTQYFGSTDPDFRDNRVWDINRKTLEVLGKFRDRYNIVLKLLPGNYKNALFKQYLKDNGFNNIVAMEGIKKILHLVPDTDLFIFDFVSTGFFEASVGNSDIFVYSGEKFSEDIAGIIKSRAHLYGNFDEFLKALHLYLEKGNFQTWNRNKIFIEQYLNIKEGQDNIGLAADTIAKIADKQYAGKQ